MHDDNDRAAGATYIGPGAFAIAFCAVCGLFLAIVLGFNHATAFFDVAQPDPVAAAAALQSEPAPSAAASAVTHAATGAAANGVENPALKAMLPPPQPRPLLRPIARLGSTPIVMLEPTLLPQRKPASARERKPTPMVDHPSAELPERKPLRATERAPTAEPERNLTSTFGHTSSLAEHALSPGRKSSPTAARKLTFTAELKPASGPAPQPAPMAVTKPASPAVRKQAPVTVTKPVSPAVGKPGAVAPAKPAAPTERKSAAPIGHPMTQRKPAIAPPAVSTERPTEPILVPSAAAAGSASLLVPLKGAAGVPASNSLQPARVERGALLIAPPGQ